MTSSTSKSDVTQLALWTPKSANRPGFVHETNSPKVSVEWYTPPGIFQALGVTYDMDVASPGAAVVPWVPARVHLTKADNALVKEWSGIVWMNPPYGAETPKFMARFLKHANGIALVFARTDTRWFGEICRHPATLCFTSGRIRFVSGDGKPSGQPGCGSLLVGMGTLCRDAVRNSRLGIVFDTK